MKKEKNEMIEAYLANNLSSIEREQFENDLATNPALQDEVTLHNRISEALTEPDVVRLETELTNIMQSNRKTKNVKTKFRVANWWQIAAALLFLGISATILYQVIRPEVSPDQLYQSYLQLPSDLERKATNRSINQSDDNSFYPQFFESYKKGDFSSALNLLEQLPETNPNLFNQYPNIYNFFLGVTLIQLNQNAAAVIALEKVKTGEYTEDAEWFRALSLFSVQGNTREVRSAFEEIALNEYHPNQKQANKMLSSLKQD